MLAKRITASSLKIERLAYRVYLCSANGLITHSVFSEERYFEQIKPSFKKFSVGGSACLASNSANFNAKSHSCY
jgi:hypothetical protein